MNTYQDYVRKVLGCCILVVSLPHAGHVLSDGMVLPSEIWTHMVQWLPPTPPDTPENYLKYKTNSRYLIKNNQVKNRYLRFQ